MKHWHRNTGRYALAVALLAAGAVGLAARARAADQPGAAAQPSAAAHPPAAARPAAARTAAGIWLDSLQMTSASTGWALRWTQNPAVVDHGYLAPARTTSGARTWTAVTPAAARRLLSTSNATVVLQALTGDRAWLAVTAATAATMNGTMVHTTEVFLTADGGRTWTESVPLKVPGFAEFLSLAGPEHGWLLEDIGSGQSPGAGLQVDHVALYRTRAGGLRWSRVAQTLPPPQTGTGRNGLPVRCDKSGLTFATASAGWLTGACNLQADVLRVSRDGGAHWSRQPLPVPATACATDGCAVSGPQFAGRAGFLTIARAPAAPYFLVSRDLGVTWRRVALPPGAGLDPRIQFFGPRRGVLVSAGPQDAIGRVFYTTADAGRTWTAVRPGRSFTRVGSYIDFVSARAGFAWELGADSGSLAPAMDQTRDAGRTWQPFTPRLAS